MTSQALSKDLLYLYRRLLRACETYPSKNRARIYQSIREDFRENVNMDPDSPEGIKQIHIAYKGLGQLQQFNSRNNPNFSVTLEQNPFPKPDGYKDRRTESANRMLEKHDDS
ncbi:unnamed protein product [Cylindrotheca closterium]|uniref:Complex 1 LYR protein domain-containing protein n=1 Tax=Cylindrotheca closterium TaxID=2856 RepID=A0AAD2FB88_9STRA|nr:unnamed protein product [Cylindrotheca closterium]